MTPIAIILCGIPCSGKTSYIESLPHSFYPISREQIKEKQFGKGILAGEEGITNYYNRTLSAFIKHNHNIVVSNTHCQKVYIDAMLERFEGLDYIVKIKFFDIPLWQVYIKNLWRYITAGKYVPWTKLRNAYKNFKKIDRSRYSQYILK